MVVDDTIAQALNRIAEGQEEMNNTLTRIANHYDGVVPVMTRNANRAEAQGKAIDEEVNNSFGQQVRDIFRPQEN
jgi:superoxide dismutase